MSLRIVAQEAWWWIVWVVVIFLVLAVGPRIAQRLDDQGYPGALVAFGGIALLLAAAALGMTIFMPATRRARALRRTASELDLAFRPRFRLPPSSRELPGLGLQAGGAVDVRHLMAGDHEGDPVLIFDKTVETATGYGRPHRMTCVMSEIDAECPMTIIESRHVSTQRVLDGLDEVRFESEAFDRRFRVATSDRTFASVLVDARMMDQVLAASGPITFEAGGRWLMMEAHQLEPDEIPEFLETFVAFRRHVPRVLSSIYPPPDPASV
jgi:hypothetical protein